MCKLEDLHGVLVCGEEVLNGFGLSLKKRGYEIVINVLKVKFSKLKTVLNFKLQFLQRTMYSFLLV